MLPLLVYEEPEFHLFFIKTGPFRGFLAKVRRCRKKRRVASLPSRLRRCSRVWAVPTSVRWSVYNFVDGTAPYFAVLVFYRWTTKPPKPEWNPQHVPNGANSHEGDGLWFANQIKDNAAAVQALTLAVMNAEGAPIGEVMRELKNFTTHMPSEGKGLAMSSWNVFKIAAPGGRESVSHPWGH